MDQKELRSRYAGRFTRPSRSTISGSKRRIFPSSTSSISRICATVELKPWTLKGGNGAILNLIGTGDVNDGYLSEIPPGQSLKPQRAMYEELIFVLEGTGSTAIWNDENKKVTFEWGPGSLFSPPLNTWRQHFNGSGDKPARFLGVTSAPPLIESIPQSRLHVQQSVPVQ